VDPKELARKEKEKIVDSSHDQSTEEE
jgi:hypothetical protein